MNLLAKWKRTKKHSLDMERKDSMDDPTYIETVEG